MAIYQCCSLPVPREVNKNRLKHLNKWYALSTSSSIYMSFRQILIFLILTLCVCVHEHNIMQGICQKLRSYLYHCVCEKWIFTQKLWAKTSSYFFKNSIHLVSYFAYYTLSILCNTKTWIMGFSIYCEFMKGYFSFKYFIWLSRPPDSRC